MDAVLSGCYAFCAEVDTLKVCKINLMATNLLPSHATFRITDNCRYCIKDFDFDFVPTIPCDDGMTMISVDPNPYLASTVAGYFDICFDLAQGGLTPDALLTFWCEPPMVVDYTFILLSGYVQGLGMLDLGLLRQMAARDEKVTGAEGRVEEVVVMDMYGRQVFRSGNTGTIDVGSLTTGSYIVRIKVNGAHGTEVYYRKLIKK